MARVVVQVVGNSAMELESLHEWLRRDRRVLAHGDIELGRAPEPGHLGVPIDLLSLVIGGGLSAFQLLVAIAGWRKARPDPPVVVIIRPGVGQVVLAENDVSFEQALSLEQTDQPEEEQEE